MADARRAGSPAEAVKRPPKAVRQAKGFAKQLAAQQGIVGSSARKLVKAAKVGARAGLLRERGKTGKANRLNMRAERLLGESGFIPPSEEPATTPEAAAGGQTINVFLGGDEGGGEQFAPGSFMPYQPLQSTDRSKLDLANQVGGLV